MVSYQIYHQGRCSVIQAVVLATTTIVSLLIHPGTIHATTFTVGDSSGWNFNVGNWTNGKNFNAGDILVFNYDPSLHNIVAVDVNEYISCTASATSKTYTSGKDQVKLSMGHHYYICSIPGHCDGGLKMIVNAS